MKKVLMIVAAALSLTGCVSYRGGSFAPDFQTSDERPEAGTMGVSSGDFPGPLVTGSDAVPRESGR